MRLLLLILFSLSIALSFGFANILSLPPSHAKSDNQTQFLSPIKIASKGAHGADLFVDPKINEIYIAYI